MHGLRPYLSIKFTACKQGGHKGGRTDRNDRTGGTRFAEGTAQPTLLLKPSAAPRDAEAASTTGSSEVLPSNDRSPVQTRAIMPRSAESIEHGSAGVATKGRKHGRAHQPPLAKRHWDERVWGARLARAPEADIAGLTARTLSFSLRLAVTTSRRTGYECDVVAAA